MNTKTFGVLLGLLVLGIVFTGGAIAGNEQNGEDGQVETDSLGISDLDTQQPEISTTPLDKCCCCHYSIAQAAFEADLYRAVPTA